MDLNRREKALSPPFRRMLSRAEAAAHTGVSPSTLDRMITDKLMPGPKRIYGRVLWDVRALDAAIDAIPGGEMDDCEVNEWDEVL